MLALIGFIPIALICFALGWIVRDVQTARWAMQQHAGIAPLRFERAADAEFDGSEDTHRFDNA